MVPRPAGFDITWTPPVPGVSEITSYDLRFIKSDASDKNDDDNWTVRRDIRRFPANRHRIKGLEAQVRYDVQLRAVNEQRTGGWSGTVTATTRAAIPNLTAGCAAPDLLNRRQVWRGTLTVADVIVAGNPKYPQLRVGWGYSLGNLAGTLTGRDTPIVIGSNSYTIGDYFMQFEYGEPLEGILSAPSGALTINLNRFVTATEQAELALHVCDDDYRFSDADKPEVFTGPAPPGSFAVSVTGHDYNWKESAVTWTAGQQHVITISMPTSSMATAAPTVTAAPTISPPGPDQEWTEGESVDVTLTFSEAMTVDTSGGTPSIGLLLGGTSARRAPYRNGTGTGTLTFGYTLTTGDGSHTAMLVPPDSLALGGGAVRSKATRADAALEHDGAAASAAPRTDRQTRGAPPLRGPRASFQNLPETHDGETPFEVELHLSPEPESLSYRAVQAAVAATGGTVTRARRDAPGENRAWHVEITPNQGDNITLTLPALPCDAKNALCIDGEPLEAGAAATVSGQPFRAWFNQAPEEHDGENAFDLRLHFSHETEVSYRTVQDHLLSVKGGEIQRAWRLEHGKNRNWGITTLPDGLADVTITVIETTHCSEEHAVCDAAGRMLPGGLETTAAGPPTLSVEDSGAGEAEGATLIFTVTLSRALPTPVTVDYATQDGTAMAGSDYTHGSGTLTLEAGSTSQTIHVAVTDDTEDEDEQETFTLTLSSASGAHLADGNDTLEATATITDNDDPQVTVSFEQTGYSVTEGNAVDVTVTLSADPERTLTIPLTRPGGGGASPSDHSGTPASLTFNSGQTSRSFPFTATDDDLDDDGESVLMEFGNLPDRVSAGSPSSCTVSITDNDKRGVALSETSLSVTPGGSRTYEAALTSQPTASVTVTITGHSGSGLRVSPGSLAFTAGNWDTAQTVTVSAAEGNGEAGDAVSLAHTASGGDYDSVTPVSVSVAINDNGAHTDEGQ